MQEQPKPIYVTKPSMPPYEEYCQEVADLWESGILTHGGAKHQEFEARLKEMTGSPFVTLFTNGHLALEAVLNSFGGPGEVITTPFTFVSTTMAIVRAGLTPVFCDIKADDYTIDPTAVEALITERTVAILPVHVYGLVCDVEALEAIAAKHGLKLIFDAAHAFGVRVGDRDVSSFGDASMFSFHATKVMNTGEGGALMCKDEELKFKLDAWKYYGFTASGGEIPYYGTNAKMTEFAASMGLCNLRHFEEELAKRAAIEAQYRELLAEIPGVGLCAPQANVKSNHAYFPVTIENRDEVIDRMAQDNIFPRKYFYPLTNEYECFASAGFDPTETPIAFKASRQVMTLPMYASLSPEEVERVCASLARAMK